LAIKVKVIADVTVYDGNKTYGRGSVFDYSGGAEAVEKLVSLGYVEKAGVPAALPLVSGRDAKKKRKEAENKAVNAGLGTAEEIAGLSDVELFALAGTVDA
jgi:hypothetical protein